MKCVEVDIGPVECQWHLSMNFRSFADKRDADESSLYFP